MITVMIVVTIIGVLVTLAIVYMRPRVRPLDVANRIGDMVHEAGRRAVALGPLPPAVVQALGSRARTQITADVLEAADRLIAIGCFSVGTNQVDVDASRRNGIPVFNAPFSNTRSVAELVIG